MLTVEYIVNERTWSPFLETDSFNPQNEVQGYISHHNGDDYGALFIEKVNGQAAPQLIYCTPKIKYPFDAHDKWHFPKAQRIERYEKLDGTNVYVYSYTDSLGQPFCSAKTRLKPFLGNSKFGPFKDLWDEATKDYFSILRQMVLEGDYNFSFELWGAANTHLIKYETPMQASLLFARKGQVLVPPSALHNIKFLQSAPFLGNVTENYIENYKTTQTQIDGELQEIADGFLGQEGEVWYLQTVDNTWELFKCKPQQIEQIHWAAGGIGKNVIKVTCQNAYENWDEPTVDNIVELLKEEFTTHEIEKVMLSIQKHLLEVHEQHIFKEKVLEKYATLGVNILVDKTTTMRAMSAFFNKNEMTKVYTTILTAETT